MIIEKNVPIPSDPRGRRNLYAFEDMEVGDSMKARSIAGFDSLRNAASRYKRLNEGWDYTTRKTDLRLWRTK